MKRREFTLTLTGAAAVAASTTGLWPLAAHAQGAPVEGQQYTRLGAPVPIGEPGKIEVIEFFWYGCPHCNHFEPTLEPWVAKLGKDVRFRRVHVGFNALHQIHQHLYYTLESMGLVDQLHAKVFHRFHDEHKPLNNVEDATTWVASQGVDPQKFRGTWDSFSVQTKMRQATNLVTQYNIDGVPTMAVQGRYKTGPAEGGGEAQCLQVVDFLIDKTRRGA